MAKIFYCGGLSGHIGILRAVIPVAHLSSVLSKESPKYVGKSFPRIKPAGPQCTVIEVAGDEERGRWKPGFYRTSKAPVAFEENLKTLPG